MELYQVEIMPRTGDRYWEEAYATCSKPKATDRYRSLVRLGYTVRFTHVKVLKEHWAINQEE